jgi:hypothetical protein
MQEIVSLIHFSSNVLSKSLHKVFLGLLTPKEEKLYSYLISNTDFNERTIAQQLFSEKHTSINFKRTKASLKEKLYAAVIFIKPNANQLPKFADDLIYINKISGVHKVLTYFGRNDLYIPIIEENIKYAYQNFMLPEVIQFASSLFSHYKMREKNEIKSKYYRDVLIEANTSLYWENLSYMYYSDINTEFSFKKKVAKRELEIKIDTYIAELNPGLKVARSLAFINNYYQLLMINAFLEKHYEPIITYCDKVLDYYLKWNPTVNTIYKNTLKIKAEHLILLGKYDSALKLLDECLTFDIEGVANWFVTMRHKVAALTKLRLYKEANDVLDIITSQKNFTRLKGSSKSTLIFYKIYFSLLEMMRVLPFNEEVKYSQILARLYKENEQIKKDREAMNIPLIAAQLIEAIINKDDSTIIDREEALQKYSSRYVTKNNSVRSNCFINMLLIVVKQNFHVVAIRRHTQKLYARLAATPPHLSGEAAEVEIIPYEHLWEILMDFLSTRSKK